MGLWECCEIQPFFSESPPHFYSTKYIQKTANLAWLPKQVCVNLGKIKVMTVKSEYQRQIEDRLIKSLQIKIELNLLFLQAVTKEDWDNAGTYQDAMEEEDKEIAMLVLIKESLLQ